MKPTESKRIKLENEPEEFKIEKNIKLPMKMNIGRKYPFGNLQPGDSFIISNIYSRELMNKYATAARAWRINTRHQNWRFAVRKTEDDKIRIYRINDFISNG